ncbi:MAG: SprT-like domain-containing protein [Verrucomicrobiae bacterium]|nr:SprT-like domain-containing protein [Verrucomicrobiae bacterium]
MPDQGVPCQLEFFGEFDFSAPGEATHTRGSRRATGRMPTPLLPERVRRAPEIDSKLEPLDKASAPHDESELTRHAANLVTEVGLPRVARKVSVHWNPRMRTAAGRAFYESLRIELNPGLLSLKDIDVDAEVDRTLRHELAHLVAYQRAGKRRIPAHGDEWRQACVDLGIPDESRCHTLPFEPRRVKKKLVYECPSCGSQIHRVRRYRQAVACYDCCQQFSHGRYDDRFRLKARRLKEA